MRNFNRASRVPVFCHNICVLFVSLLTRCRAVSIFGQGKPKLRGTMPKDLLADFRQPLQGTFNRKNWIAGERPGFAPKTTGSVRDKKFWLAKSAAKEKDLAWRRMTRCIFRSQRES